VSGAAWAVVAAFTDPSMGVDLAVDASTVVSGSRGGAVVYDLQGTELDRLVGVEVRAVGHVFGEPVVGTPTGAWRWGPRGWERVGPRQAVVAVDGDRLLYDGQFDEAVVDAVWFEGRAVGFTADGRVLGAALPRLPGPVSDAEVVHGELRVACHVAGAVWDGERWQRIDVPAVTAGSAWGTAEGVLFDDDGRRIGAVGAAPVAVAAHDDGWLVSTDEGLQHLGMGVVSWTEPELPCRPFVTGLTVHDEQLVVGTFDGGACVRGEQGWEALDLPTPLVNDVRSHGGGLWVATSQGLYRFDDDGREGFGVAEGRSDAGLHHEGVADLDAVGGRLWVADVLGPIEVSGDRWRRHRYGVSGHSHTSVAACDDGTVWVGTEDDGLAVRGVEVGRRNGRAAWRHVNRFDGLPEDWVMELACAGDRSAWVGLYRRGLGRMGPDGWTTVVPDVWVQSLAVDGEALWVGTADGLLWVDDHGVAEVLPERDVHALLVDDGGVWVGTRAGLLRLEPVDNSAILATRPTP
jgi:hypothetical protein